MGFETVRNVAILIGGFVGLFSLVKGVFEYSLQNRQKRAELFQQCRREFLANESFQRLLPLLECDDPTLANIPYREKYALLAFFESVALLLYSGLLKRHVVHYMYSYYAIRCWKSENFWQGLNRQSPYWALYDKFVKDMKKIEESFFFRLRNYKL